MISEKDLRDAISECIAAPNPNSHTCMMLAAFYTILDHMEKDDPGNTGLYSGDSEFSAVAGKVSPGKLAKVFDNLMQTLQAVNPMLYDATINELNNKRQE